MANKEALLKIRITAAEKEHYATLAEKQDLSLSQWVRRLLRQTAPTPARKKK